MFDKLSGRINIDMCGYCGHQTNWNGDDFCLGHLDESIVMNACCGHGGRDYGSAHIQVYVDVPRRRAVIIKAQAIIKGEFAIDKINELKGEQS